MSVGVTSPTPVVSSDTTRTLVERAEALIELVETEPLTSTGSRERLRLAADDLKEAILEHESAWRARELGR